MADLAVNQPQTQRRVAGSLEAYAMQLLTNGGSEADVTGLTMTFSMIAHSGAGVTIGASVISAAAATVTSATAGQVSYTFSSAHAEGVYAVYFQSSASRWPYEGAMRRIEFVSDIE